MYRYVYLVVVAIALMVGGAQAQDVGALRAANWQLPQTVADGVVLSDVFDVINAVQTPCPQSLVDSLIEQGALAACGTPTQASTSVSDRLGSHGRQLIELRLRRGSWLTPWQQDSGFGTVRQYSYQGSVYFVALNSSAGLAYVIRFEP